MRNSVGGVIAALLGAWTLANAIGTASSGDLIETVLSGASSLSATISSINEYTATVWRLMTWGLMGIAEGLFSKRGWNSVRTTCWAGVTIASLSLISTLIREPQFWNSPDRNMSILILFVLTLIAAQTSLILSIPTASLAERLKTARVPPVPEKIEAICACGARFKSRPRICSECGRTLVTESDSVPER